MIRATAVAALVVACALPLAAPPACAATYRGHSVDSRRYVGSITNADYGKVDGVEIRFRDEHAYVTIRGAGRLVLILQDEDIADPHRIAADDPRHGITWEIDVRDITAGSP
jgi:hypothetical protein